MAVASNAESKLIKSRLTQISRDSGVVFIGNILDKLFGFAFTVGIAKLYGLKVFGLFVLGLTICQFGSLAFNLGFGNGLIRYVSLYKKDQAKLKGIIWTAGLLSVSLAVVVGAGLFFAADPVVRHFFARKDRLAIVLKCLAFTLPLSAASGIWVRTLVGLKNFKAQAYIRSLIEPATKVGAALVFFLLGLKLEGLILAFLVSTVVASAAAYHLYSAALRGRLKGIRPIFQFRELMSYCWPLVLRNLVSKASRRADVLLLGAFRNPIDVTLYTFAQRLSTLGTFITDAFENAYAPHIPALHADGKREELRHGFQTVTRWTMLLTVPIFVMLIAFPEIIIPVLGEQFAPAATAVSIVTAATFVSYATGPSQIVILMSGHSKISLANRLATSVVALGFNIWLIPRYGILGAAIACVAAAVAGNLLASGIVYVMMGLHPIHRSYLKALAAGLVATIAGKVCQGVFTGNKYLALISQGVVVLVSYGVALLLLGLDREDKGLWRQLWGRWQSLKAGLVPRPTEARSKSGD
ncbi:MAG: oligosaccharide flippase family protein [Acidobacteria bacterium]|nr:oligosaccharide flippase family protein [Acidobacteriota bacterium]